MFLSISKRVKKHLSQVYFAFAFILWSLLLWAYLILLSWSFLIPKERRVGLIQAIYCYPVCWSLAYVFAGIRPVVRGKEHLPPVKKNFMVISNHTSLLDIPVFFTVTKCNFIMKSSLMFTPVGFPGIMGGCVLIDRDNLKSQMKAMHEAVSMVQNAASMHVFAEGTRNRSGGLLPFKRGMIGMLYKAQIPLLPAGIWGNHLVVKDNLEVSLGRKVGVVLHELIHPQDYATRDEFHQACWNSVKVASKKAEELVLHDKA